MCYEEVKVYLFFLETTTAAPARATIPNASAIPPTPVSGVVPLSEPLLSVAGFELSVVVLAGLELSGVEELAGFELAGADELAGLELSGVVELAGLELSGVVELAGLDELEDDEEDELEGVELDGVEDDELAGLELEEDDELEDDEEDELAGAEVNVILAQLKGP